MRPITQVLITIVVTSLAFLYLTSAIGLVTKGNEIAGLAMFLGPISLLVLCTFITYLGEKNAKKHTGNNDINNDEWNKYEEADLESGF